MYEEMLAYIKKILAVTYKPQKLRSKAKADRYGHSKRVFFWAQRLAKGMEDQVDMEALQIAAIFHDSGYGMSKYPKKHADTSAEIAEQYLTERDYPKEKIDFICYLVQKHSDRTLLQQEDTPLELVLLMEADLLDGTGAHGIIMDVWMEALENEVNYTDMYHHILRFTNEQTKYNPMRTKTAQKIWEGKQELVRKFINDLEIDLGLDVDGKYDEKD